jgi:DNA-directed RNA polymerase subunit RPC12/RpoP
MIQALPVCKGCGQSIWGGYVTALGAAWHPEHFVCAACSRPFADMQFTILEGAPYHVECLEQQIAPRCAVCSRPITDTQYTVHNGASYHTACYDQQIAPRCAYCGKILHDHLVDQWGTHFCKEHQYEFPSCVYCGRRVPPQQQEAGREPDEGIRCPICRSSAVETIEAARPLYSQVKQWVARQGLVYNNLQLSLDLCGPSRLATLAHGHVQGHAHGITEMVTYRQNGRELYTEVKGVAVLRGLPDILFQGVVAHELGHVWMAVHGVSNLPLWAQEGFCELLSYNWYKEVNTPESLFHAHNIEQRTDSVYGEGFKRIYALAKAVGFPRLIETLQTQKRLPI